MITPLYLESSSKRPRLRVAILIDEVATRGARGLPRYVAAILEDIARSNFAEVVLAVVLGPAPDGGRSGSLLHQLYVRADRAVGGALDPLAPFNSGAFPATVEQLAVAPGGPGQDWLAREAIDDLARHDLDVILRFCTERPRGEVLRAARHGVWSYHFGSDADPRNGPPFFNQVVERSPTRDVLLEVLEEEPASGLVLCRSSFGIRGSVFLADLRRVAFGETTHFVVWKLHDLHELGWEHVRAQATPRARPASGLAATTSTQAMVRYLAPRLASAALHRVRGQRKEHALAIRWKIALRRGTTPFGSTADTTTLAGFRWIEPPAGHFWADPFLIGHRGSTVVLFEDYDYAKGYGTIRGAEVQQDCTLGTTFPCMDTGRHLSFPHVFVHDGETFMIPESLADGTVSLYRARRFPDDWVKEKDLFLGNAADTTFWKEGSRFYFFTTLHERDDRGMKTFLFMADSLTGDWRLHRSNPVSSDIRHARGAGAIFRRQGRLFRPSQDCAAGYGHGLNLEEIVTLSEERYEERPWCAVGPDTLPFPAVGVHTYSAYGDLEATDACVSL